MTGEVNKEWAMAEAVQKADVAVFHSFPPEWRNSQYAKELREKTMWCEFYRLTMPYPQAAIHAVMRSYQR